jgi:phospholipase/carboxylesterase
MSLEPASDGVPRYSWGAEDFDDPQIEQYVFRCIEQTRRSYHIHSERIYLVGFREGAALAYRLGLLYPERFGGVVSVNGRMPRVGRPRLRLPEVRSLRVLIQHGIDNNEISADDAKQDAKLFYSAGMPVEMRTYATTHRIHADMLRGIDSWIQDHISEEFDLLAE